MVIKGMKLWRCIQDSLSNALPTPDTRVVLIVGPRQSGKTTLAKKMANKGME
jgi:predicted AAA+ superfamily ATPase